MATASACDTKEYAQYKDEAATERGQVALAREHCEAWTKMQMAQARVSAGGREADLAVAEMRACGAERTKIMDALTAAKAKKAVWDYLFAGCQGAPP